MSQKPASNAGWPSPVPERPRWLARALLTMVLVIAAAGLVYELVIAAVASYVLGDSVRQFSLIIGLYLSALGLGAFLSKALKQHLETAFVDVELGAALIGGLSAPGLFLAFSFSGSFHLVLYTTVLTVGVLVGLELPILMRILEREYEFKELIARALTFDYAGALVGSVAFSLLLVPRVGLLATSILCGMLNAIVALCSTWLLRDGTQATEKRLSRARVRAVMVLLLLLAALLGAERILQLSETALLGGEIVYAKNSDYQRIVVTKRHEVTRLYLNGNLQFSSRDEHRYHEALVHPAMAAARRPRDVLIGGGGDGLAAREVLKWPDVRSVTVVDLDPAVTRLGRDDPTLSELNQRSLHDPRVKVVNGDAMSDFRLREQQYDVILLDFPDPSSYSVGKLYSTRFYRMAYRRLRNGGALSVQSTSPLFAPRAFWCVVSTLEAVGFSARAYHTFVPSFGDWGYVLATRSKVRQLEKLPPAEFGYLDDESMAELFVLPRDIARVPTAVNHLNSQALVAYYLEEWARFD